MIPRTIHRIWLDEPVPPAFEEFGARWRELNPGWTLKDWTSSKEIPDSFPCSHLRADVDIYFPNDRVRAVTDILRLELLLEGGVYADMDCEPTAPLDPWFHELEHLRRPLGFVAARSPQHHRGVHPITNAFLAAAPLHSFTAELVGGLELALRSHAGRSLARTIGPWHLTRTYEAKPYQWDAAGVVVLADSFYRQSRVVTHHWNTARRKRGDGLG